MKKKTAKDELSDLAVSVLSFIKTSIYINLPYMGRAMDALPFVCDLRTRTFGTDSYSIRFNPNFVLESFLNRRDVLVRGYMQSLIHCIFCHMYRQDRYEDKELFSLCADISAESIVDSIDDEAVYRLSSDYRDKVYERLYEAVDILTPDRLYGYYTENPLDFDEFNRLKREFEIDDHSFWEQPDKNENKTPNPRDSLNEKNWEDRAMRLKDDLIFGKDASADTGSLEKMLKLSFSSKTDYRKILEKYAVFREEMKIDPDTFDYGLYMYGLSTYGNMPLIEENEYSEHRAVDELVIAIDTSASCQGRQVQSFLNETAALLKKSGSFFKRTKVVIIECDNRIQKTTWLTDAEKIAEYAGGFSVAGGFGTDFRPVFNYVEDLRSKGRLRNLKGLLYFTDGYGEYPKTPTSYETSFVIWDGAKGFDKIPEWANTLYFE